MAYVVANAKWTYFTLAKLDLCENSNIKLSEVANFSAPNKPSYKLM